MLETLDRKNKIVRDIKALSVPTEKVETVKEGEIIATTLFQYLTKNTDGIGLAANQLGINKRVAVVNVTQPIYLVNPEIVEVGNEIIFQEGCLSVKSKKPIKTKRYDRIVIKCDNYEHNLIFEPENENDMDGLLECVCVQHEIDHLDGKTILDRKYIPETLRVEKIGRNQKVVISDGSEAKIIKYKKAEKLINEGSITDDYFRTSIKEFKELLDDQYKNAKNYKPKIEWFEGTWSRYKPARGKDKRGVTGYDVKKLKNISEKINTIPKEINIHKTIAKVLENRKSNVNNEEKIDWSTAEALAFGSLLEEGYPVRLVGQDSGRGTFSQRHSVLRNQIDNSRYVPLNKISKNQKNFEIVDSFLSELAVLGFEYGYSLVEPNTLTIWEAQFGDFANGAQVVIDQFIASGERKWSRASGLVMLLPHGYEGQGPEHSSARLERFLQLCSNDNMQVMNCTTPANYFHTLRRQMHRDFRKPLIIMTPKSLLRHKHCVSSLSDFSKKNTFHRVLWDHAIDPKVKGFIKLKKKEKIKKVILCSGKIYFDLLEAREKFKKDDLIFYRIEQLYPFPAKALAKELKPYAKKAKFYWCQEEPKNMGAWFSARDYIQWTLDNIKANNKKISYIGRSPDASPATGYAKRHISQQQEIIKKVFE